MRATAATLSVAVLVLVGCTSGDGAAKQVLPTTGSAPSVTGGSTSTTVIPPATVDPAGSVTLRATAISLAAGPGLRVVVRAATGRLVVRSRGATGGLLVCPVSDVTTITDLGRCLELGAEREVDLGVGRGVEIRATVADTTVEEVAISYLPVDRSMTLVTPARAASVCPRPGCESRFSLSPARAGSFVLQGRSVGGRSSLTLQAGPAASASATRSQVLSTVEGEGSLAITATVEPSLETVLVSRQPAQGPVGTLTMEIVWP